MKLVGKTPKVTIYSMGIRRGLKGHLVGKRLIVTYDDLKGGICVETGTCVALKPVVLRGRDGTLGDPIKDDDVHSLLQVKERG